MPVETSGSDAAYVSAHTLGFERLGTVLDHTFTAEEAMAHGHLGGWNTRTLPVFAKQPNGTQVAMPDRAAVVRDSPFKKGQVDYLGDVGANYQVIQNEAHAGILNALVDESGSHFDTAGSVDGGRKVFLTMLMPGHINIGGIDPVQNRIVAFNSHDGSMSFTIMVTAVRHRCSNILNLAFENRSHIIRVRHSSGAEAALARYAREALDISFEYLDGFQREAEMMINTTLTQSQFEEIITREFGAGEDAAKATVTRSDRKIEEILDLFVEAPTNANIRGTAWAGLNAITEWYDHFSTVRGDDRDNSRAEKSILSPKAKNRARDLMMAVV